MKTLQNMLVQESYADKNDIVGYINISFTDAENNVHRLWRGAPVRGEKGKAIEKALAGISEEKLDSLVADGRVKLTYNSAVSEDSKPAVL